MRFTEAQNVKAIKGWLSGPQIVGEFGQQPLTYINEMTQALELQAIEVSQTIDSTDLFSGIETVLTRLSIQTFNNKEAIEQQLEESAHYTALYIIDCQAIQWAEIQEHDSLNIDFWAEKAQSYNLLWAMNYDAQNVLEVIENIQPLGIELLGGMELDTGLQSFENIDPIIDVLEMEEE